MYEHNTKPGINRSQEPAGEAESGQVKRFQATEGEMRAMMALNESAGLHAVEVLGWHLPQLVVLIRAS